MSLDALFFKRCDHFFAFILLASFADINWWKHRAIEETSLTANFTLLLLASFADINLLKLRVIVEPV